ncbi:serine hydrolase-like protein [Parasteatoda tepidariorum]|uniref:serine hydrolase-like protein n=1 Tax=Parasteatoda tepidariorum TaxID=114398 RepID=UPI001C728DAE|nr:serine hydrolase-like protein [Parasteatoda tepidariorum]
MHLVTNITSKILFRNCLRQISQHFQGCLRNNHLAANDCLGTTNVKELCIPTPYGKIAAKAWGAETGKPVLAFHGWLDNCGTFDKLFPLLSKKLYIVAVDAPGCGLSSHKPLGCLYSDIDTILEYKRVVEFLGWEKFSILGHSLGGAMGLFFTSMHSEIVEKVVALDIAKVLSVPLGVFPGIIAKSINDYIKQEKKLSNLPPVYTPESAIERLLDGMHGEITREGAEILLKRGSRPSDCGKGVIFTRDLRCRPVEYLNVKNHELMFQYIKAIRSEMLLIMATNPHPNYISNSPEMREMAYEIYRKNSKRFVLEHVEGNHFVHLNNPERVAPLVNKFLAD